MISTNLRCIAIFCQPSLELHSQFPRLLALHRCPGCLGRFGLGGRGWVCPSSSDHSCIVLSCQAGAQLQQTYDDLLNNIAFCSQHGSVSGTPPQDHVISRRCEAISIPVLALQLRQINTCTAGVSALIPFQRKVAKIKEKLQTNHNEEPRNMVNFH